MDVGGVFASGLDGLQQAQRRLDAAAQDIAQEAVRDTNEANETSEAPVAEQAELQAGGPVTNSVIELNQAENQALSAAKVVKTADEVLGSIIDIKV